MTVDSLISIMEKLLKLHKSLLDLSFKKTDIVNKGDIAALDLLLKDEQAHMAAINKLESERAAVVVSIEPKAQSLIEVAERTEGEKRTKLLALRDELLETVGKIKARNELNQQLIHQSLQFINFSKSLVMPQEKEINYRPPAGHKPQQGKPSGMFNTKA